MIDEYPVSIAEYMETMDSPPFVASNAAEFQVLLVQYLNKMFIKSLQTTTNQVNTGSF